VIAIPVIRAPERPLARQSSLLQILGPQQAEGIAFDVRGDPASDATGRTGERGRTISAPASRAGLARLVEARYVTEHAVSMDAVLYLITDLGRRAAGGK
jgi:hypothetical protein